jgi:hypothetical protein
MKEGRKVKKGGGGGGGGEGRKTRKMVMEGRSQNTKKGAGVAYEKFQIIGQ